MTRLERVYHPSDRRVNRLVRHAPIARVATTQGFLGSPCFTSPNLMSQSTVKPRCPASSTVSRGKAVRACLRIQEDGCIQLHPIIKVDDVVVCQTGATI